ncbi:hypothetical protein GH714_035811 [Hevea brasiliensis]|uniref:Tf2-1-like SH3-like domain-containing protein n=1 Tax=Hevea brasiliensis TaxID=3981 RepID=A0A6A6LT67_HEVBR|nr:hypothetical protein GH714_035811 [Hevea brasiliensis]
MARTLRSKRLKGVGIGEVLSQGHSIAFFSEKLNEAKQRWVEFLNEYSFVLKYRSGVENKAADALSHIAIVLHEMSANVIGFEKMKDDYDTCPDFGLIFQEVNIVDLVPLPLGICVSQPTESFAQHIHELHDEIRRKIALSNENYKHAANVHRRNKEFNVCDNAMVCICPKRFPKNSLKKLHARAIGPFFILQKIGYNAYLLDLPKNMNISPVFNVEDLSPYRGTFVPPILPSSVSTSQLVTKSPSLP